MDQGEVSPSPDNQEDHRPHTAHRARLLVCLFVYSSCLDSPLAKSFLAHKVTMLLISNDDLPLHFGQHRCEPVYVLRRIGNGEAVLPMCVAL